MNTASPQGSDTIGGGGSTTTGSAPSHPAQQIKIGKRFRLLRRLGGGAFGEVYVGTDVVTEEYVAVKLEPIAGGHQPHLQHEARLYAYLARGVVTVGLPRVRYYGREGDFNVMVLDLLGPCLEELFDACQRRFALKTVCMLADQMVSRLEFMHAMSYLHRDLKPENFVMGLGRRAHHVYLIDLGLAKRYRDMRTHEHIPYIDGKALTGTARYVSINTHLGQQQARRDDLESLAIILIYFAKGTLPWQGVRCDNKQGKYERIKQLKMATPVDELCDGLPPEFAKFLVYTRGLRFEEAPDYARCRGYFSAIMEQRGWRHDYAFQWLELRQPPSPAGGGSNAASSAAAAGTISASHSFAALGSRSRVSSFPRAAAPAGGPRSPERPAQPGLVSSPVRAHPPPPVVSMAPLPQLPNQPDDDDGPDAVGVARLARPASPVEPTHGTDLALASATQLSSLASCESVRAAGGVSGASGSPIIVSAAVRKRAPAVAQGTSQGRHTSTQAGQEGNIEEEFM